MFSSSFIHACMLISTFRLIVFSIGAYIQVLTAYSSLELRFIVFSIAPIHYLQKDPETWDIVDKSTIDPPVCFLSLQFGVSFLLNTDWQVTFICR